MTEHEERRVREYIAFSHQDGKCIVYADDGELQCNNLARHGKCIDFRKDPISDILDTIEQTRWKEFYEKNKNG